MKITSPFLFIVLVQFFSSSSFSECLFDDPKAIPSDIQEIHAKTEPEKVYSEIRSGFKVQMPKEIMCPEEIASISAEALSFQTSGHRDTYPYQSAIQEYLETRDRENIAKKLAIDLAGPMKSLTQTSLGNLYVNQLANLDLPQADKKKAIYIVSVTRYYGNKLKIGESGVAEIRKKMGPSATLKKTFEEKVAVFETAIKERSKNGDKEIIQKLAEAMARHNEIVGPLLAKPAAQAKKIEMAF